MLISSIKLNNSTKQFFTTFFFLTIHIKHDSINFVICYCSITVFVFTASFLAYISLTVTWRGVYVCAPSQFILTNNYHTLFCCSSCYITLCDILCWFKKLFFHLKFLVVLFCLFICWFFFFATKLWNIELFLVWFCSFHFLSSAERVQEGSRGRCQR